MRLSCVPATVISLAMGVAGASVARAECLPEDQEQVVPHVATVSTSAARTYFIKGAGAAGCPSDHVSCHARAYVVPDDRVMVIGSQGPYSCTLLTNRKGMTTEDWLPTSVLKPVPPTPPVAADWLGQWRTGTQDITIATAPSGMLAVTGQATWESPNPALVRGGAVNTGEVAGTAAPRGNVLAFVDGDHDKTLPFSDADTNACRIRLTLAKPFLWVWEHACGGLNVTFTGVYARVAR